MKFYEKRDGSARRKEGRKRVGSVQKMERKKGEIRFRKRNSDRRERMRDKGNRKMQEKYEREEDRM